MPPEIAAIAIVAILAGMISGIVKQVLKYKAETQKGSVVQESGSSLTMSELTVMMQQAVQESLAPMQQQIDHLEARLDGKTPAQLEAPKEDLLEDMDLYEAAQATEAAKPRRRTTD